MEEKNVIMFSIFLIICCFVYVFSIFCYEPCHNLGYNDSFAQECIINNKTIVDLDQDSIHYKMYHNNHFTKIKQEKSSVAINGNKNGRENTKIKY